MRSVPGMIALCVLCVGLIVVAPPGIATQTACCSVVITMISRDEEVNFRSNLALWLPIVEYFTILIDSKTTDDSVKVIEGILRGRAKGFHTEIYEFTGFGPARTKSLEVAWEHFPQATHVLIADPDWRPDASTMNVQDLDLAHTVFRFTVHDRNGQTKRLMDWFLRHEQGLRMRYHLHEVLDNGIDNYVVKHVPWVIHEIEKPGTWHSKVGHGDSHSVRRLLFDLSMLAKDEEAYGHDPHTHYYVGITNHGVAEGMYQENNKVVNETIMRYAAAAEKSLLLRLHSEYKSEFGQERWGVMFILADVYEKFFGDFISAERYYLLCFDLKNFLECPLKLLSLYQETGDYESSKRVVWRLITSEADGLPGDRMLTFKASLSCYVPSWAYLVLAADLYNKVAKDPAELQAAMSSGQMHYLATLKRMLFENSCGVVQGSADQLMTAMLTQAGSLPLLSQPNAVLCREPVLKSYVHGNKITLHPCDPLSFNNEELCKDFTRDLPPPIEALQVDALGEFVGLLSLFDVAHHTMFGRAERFFFDQQDLSGWGPVYTVLFAGHFNPRLVHFFLGCLQRNRYRSGRVHVTIVASKRAVDAIMQPMDACGFSSYIRDMTFDTRPFEDFSSRARALRKNYDYIEYHGMSTDANVQVNLRHLRHLLSATGIIGLSYFTSNPHQQQLQQQVGRRNISQMYPFSLESWRLVEGYLQAHGYTHLIGDRALVRFLALDIDGVLNFDALAHDSSLLHAVHGRAGRAYRRIEAEAELVTAGLGVISHASLAYGQPFRLMRHRAVLDYKDLGVDEDSFVEEMMPSFRHTMYARREPALPGPLAGLAWGRAEITEELMQQQGGSAFFLWRSSRTMTTTHNDTHCSLAFTVKASLSEPLTYSFDRAMLPPLVKLSTSPQFRTLMRMHAEQSSLDLASYRSQLLQLLHLLESYGIITVWYTPFFQTIEEPGGLGNVQQQQQQQQKTRGVKGGLSFKVGTAKSSSNPSSIEDIEQRLLAATKGAVMTDEVRNRIARLHRIGFSYEMIEEQLLALIAGPQHAEAAAVEVGATGNTSPSPPASTGAAEEGLVSSRDPEQAALIATRRAALRSYGFPEWAIEETLAAIPGALVLGTAAPDTSATTIATATASTAEIADEYSGTGSTIDEEVQKLQQKLPPHRRLDCRLGNKRMAECSKPMAAKRSTATLASTSIMKLQFEMDQMQYLTVKLGVRSAEAMKAVGCYRELHSKLLQSLSPHSTQYHAALAMPAALSSQCPGLYNKGVYLKETAVTDTPVMFSGPLPQLKKVVGLLERTDFIVMDVIVKPAVLQQLAEDLLSSAIFFDAANGQSVVAHRDDGLFHAGIRQLVRELSWALSNRASEREEVTVTAKSFFVIGMTAGASTTSPLMMTDTNSEMYGVIWLSPTDNGPVDDPSATDGLRVYDTLSSEYLSKGNVRQYNATHTEFLSYGTSLTVNVERFHRFQKSEVIPRVNNRLAIIGPGNPFMLVMPPEEQLSAAERADTSFEGRASFALVVLFSTTESVEVLTTGGGSEPKPLLKAIRPVKKEFYGGVSQEGIELLRSEV